MSNRFWALFAATVVSIIYGVTFTVAKDVMPEFVKPFGFIVMRVGGAMLLFWLISPLFTKEKVLITAFPRIMAAAFFGVALNMLTFFKGLSYTSPIMGAVLMVTTPIIVLILSSLLIKERMSYRKIIGITLGMLGTLLLILYGKSMTTAPQAGLGNLLVFINAVSYGFYLIIVKKLMDTYNAFAFVKWIYTFGFLMVLPFGWHEFDAISWHVLPHSILWKIVFVVVFSTFLTYLFNLVSMRELSPTLVAVFIYLQPLFATVFAISLEKDTLDFIKILSGILIFVGVYLVTRK